MRPSCRRSSRPTDRLTPTDTVAASPSAIQRLRLYYARHEGRVAALFFAGGFIFDTVAVGRVDSWHMIAQQTVYLAIVTAVLTPILTSFVYKRVQRRRALEAERIHATPLPMAPACASVFAAA